MIIACHQRVAFHCQRMIQFIRKALNNRITGVRSGTCEGLKQPVNKPKSGMSSQLSWIEHSPPKGGPVLRTIEKYSGVDGNSVLRILIRKAKCYRGRKQHFRRKKYRLKIEKIGHRSGRPKRLKNLDFKPKIVCRHSSAGQSIRLLRLRYNGHLKKN